MSKLQECAFSATTSPSRDIPVYIYATAGMRVLNKQDQNRIYNAIYLAYLRSDLHFYMRRDMLQTIDGELEALYGWITVNVLVLSLAASPSERPHHSVSPLHAPFHTGFAGSRRGIDADRLPIRRSPARRRDRPRRGPLLPLFSLLRGQGSAAALRSLPPQQPRSLPRRRRFPRGPPPRAQPLQPPRLSRRVPQLPRAAPRGNRQCVRETPRSRLVRPLRGTADADYPRGLALRRLPRDQSLWGGVSK